MTTSCSPNWDVTPAGLRRTFTWKDFTEAVAFVVQVGALAEEAGHHPDIDLRYNRVTLYLLTHDANGVTDKDHQLAAKIDQLPTASVHEAAAGLWK